MGAAIVIRVMGRKVTALEVNMISAALGSVSSLINAALKQLDSHPNARVVLSPVVPHPACPACSVEHEFAPMWSEDGVKTSASFAATGRRTSMAKVEKRCSKCLQVKPMGMFALREGMRGARGERRGECKECHRLYMVSYERRRCFEVHNLKEGESDDGSAD